MKKQMSFLIGMFFCGLVSTLFAGTYGGGSGTAADPYKIATKAHLLDLAATTADYSKCFILTANIDLAGETFIAAVIASDTDSSDWEFQGTAFTGAFNGNGYIIHNLTIITDNHKYLGLFGYVRDKGQVKNLGIVNANIQGGGSYIGGICGTSNGTINCCYATGTFIGNYNVSGLCGTTDGTVNQCYTLGTVTGNHDVGGLCGVSSSNTIIQCYSCATVTGDSGVGGLCGWNNNGTIRQSYAIGMVTGNSDVGGLCGRNYNNIINCFWDMETSGQTTSAGGEGKSTAEMQNASTFIGAGWDFQTPMWMICGADYPRLIWNRPDINNSGKIDTADLIILAENWLSQNCGSCDGADLTGNQKVNLYDMQVLSAHWLDEDEISDHVFEIGMETALDYEAPGDPDDTEYEFSMEIMTDDTVERIEYLTPAGYTFEIAALSTEYEDIEGNCFEIGREFDSESGQWEWVYEAEYVSNDYLAMYGDGVYVITFYYENGRSQQTSVWFGVPGTTNAIPQPTQEPIITSFVDGATLTSPFTVCWQACTDANVNSIWLDFESWRDFGNQFGPDATCTDTAITLDAGKYDVFLSFDVAYETTNSDSIPVWVGKWCETDYVITVE